MHTSWQEGGAWHTRLRGRQVFGEPRINKGTGFTPGEREALGLVGLMPYKVFSLEEQAARSYAQYCAQPSALAFLKNRKRMLATPAASAAIRNIHADGMWKK